MRVLLPDAWRAEPWKNGRGITHVVARWPDVDSGYAVRVSVAEVTEAGPFSTFPGYQRWTLRLGAARLGLDDGAQVRWVPRDVPLALAGETPLVARLPDGPTRVVNVLARPGMAEIGIGPAEGIDCAFALDGSQARRFEPRGHATAAELWIRVQSAP